MSYIDSDKRYWKQGVKLLGQPVAVGVHESRNMGEYLSTVIEASFDSSNGELIIGHNFL
jgi:protein arginine N-methyltransferase 7